MVVPLVLIVGYLVARAWPSLSLSFLIDVPTRGMRDGGIWPALVGTIYLVVISLAVSAPIGVLAAVYLNEYARDNWFNRIINLAVINLAGVPSIVHALFGLGAFVYAARFGYSIISASLTLAIMTLPVIIASTREALASVPHSFREACWNVGRHPLADHQRHRAAQLDQRHPHRRHPAGQPRRRRDRADHVHRGGLLQGGPARQPVPLQPARPVHGAVDASLHARHPGARRQGVHPLRHRRRAARLGACSSMRRPSLLRVYLRSRKKW